MASTLPDVPGAKLKQRQKFRQVNQTFGFPSFLRSQWLSSVLFVKQVVQARLYRIGQTKARQISRNLYSLYHG